MTTQVVEQAVKLQNPNFDNLTSSEKVNLTQGYLYDVSNGDKQALKDFKTAENIVVSSYANEVPTNHINKPSNGVNNSIQDNTNYSVDKTPLNSFASNNPISGNDNKFNSTNDRIDKGGEQIKDSNRSDVLRSMKDWVNENSAPNGLNMEAINNTRKAMYGEEKEAQPTGLLANVENFNKGINPQEVNNSVLHTQNPTINQTPINQDNSMFHTPINNPQEVNNSVLHTQNPTINQTPINQDNSMFHTPINNPQEVNNSVLTPKQIKEFKEDLEDMSERIEKMNIEKTLTKGNEK